ncbi:DNA-binding protein Alba [Candidatus Nanohalococcus occultus]|uniref:DNA/RNA-binding protein Alba n=1 Tax=Candidatus Nanohalococcus occultus TaxID=2978047 RepID=A0ABY8CFK1_9ARCH|nr:Archaeal DNA-binding protein [Candidatus Nanohaloarchaeota archaeon SVXNc]
MPEEDDNTVYIGSKPPMSYVLAVVTQFSGDRDEVHVKARGKAISRAVDVAEMVTRDHVEEADVEDIEIGTDEIETDEGDSMKVSSIQIDLAR